MQLAMGQDPSRDALLREIVPSPQHLETFLEQVGVSTALEDYGIAGEKDFAARVREALWHRRGRNFLLAAHLAK